ncbi:C39 family peptidase [Halopiger djelfimassiliensis]|uniref:C39 family peptidase n=1 Tax=Halopiger djelfimassiliensis TaxID=1293047 RepID=UPI0006779B4A|nr:C39 family peptidase [Halopiger djelfimassiliensis]
MDRKFITRRNAVKRIGAASITGTFLASIGTVSAQETEYVTEKRARWIAKNAIKQLNPRSEFDDWQPQGVTSPQLYYGKVQRGSSIEYEPRAWIFAIENRGDDVGYITIDADQLVTPVLAYGRSKAPHKRVGRAKKVGSANDVTVTDRYLYHGGVQFGVETTDQRMIDLRKGKILPLPAVNSTDVLKPTHNPNGRDADRTKEREITPQGSGDGPPDWSGGTDDSISGVPNWKSYDDGGASSTEYGSGDDAWDEWDGCSPIAGSMAIGYHEGIDEWDDADEREALIDRLHDDMKTDSDGITDFNDIDNGISNYAEGTYSYNGNNNHWLIKGNIEDAVANNNPPMLNMTNGPYSKDKQWLNGHSVTVVGYRKGSGYFYHKVHNGYNTSPDRISNGNWTDAFVTRITKA